MKKDIFATVKHPDRLSEYWKKEIWILAAIVIFGMIYNIGLLAAPYFQGKLLDSLVEEKSSIWIIQISLVFVLSIACIQASRYIKRFYTRRFANNTSACMRQTLYHNMIQKSTVQLSQENMGSLMTKAISDVDACAEGMRKVTTEIFDTGVAMASYFIAMCRYDFKMTILSCIFLPIAVYIAEKMKKPIYKFTSTYRKQMSRLSEDTYEIIDHAIFYRIHGREEANEQKFLKKLEDLEKSAVNANVWENSMLPVYNAIAMCGVMFVIVMGGNNVRTSNFTIGEFSTYISLFTALAYRTSKAAKLFNSVQKATVSWKRIKPYLEEKVQIEDRTTDDTSVETENKELVMKRVEFSYPGSDSPVFTNFNLTVMPGSIIGITGPVACGKTTLGKIFLGNYSYKGNIRIGARELSSLNCTARSKIIDYMGHESQLLSDSIYSNITLGDDGDISDVLHCVCFEEDLQQMPDGIHTIVGNNGVRLSGGQQERIALARTIYHRRQIVILDDPFAALDKKTEERIIHNLMDLKGNSIFIVFSHRFKIFESADKVVIFNNDHTFTYGSHESLMEDSMLYRELYTLSCIGEEASYEK